MGLTPSPPGYLIGMDAERDRWVAAGTALVVDPLARVACPRCGSACITVQDAPLVQTGGVERHLRCPACGAYEAILMRRPQS